MRGAPCCRILDLEESTAFEIAAAIEGRSQLTSCRDVIVSTGCIPALNIGLCIGGSSAGLVRTCREPLCAKLLKRCSKSPRKYVRSDLFKKGTFFERSRPVLFNELRPCVFRGASVAGRHMPDLRNADPVVSLPFYAGSTPRDLSARQERFCQLYVSGRTATEAYRQAYGNVKTARVAGSRLLTSVNVQLRVKPRCPCPPSPRRRPSRR